MIRFFTLPGKKIIAFIRRKTANDVTIVFGTTTISSNNKKYDNGPVITGSFFYLYIPIFPLIRIYL